MSDQRFIIEMGTGNDQFGMDYTKAAVRAIDDAIWHSSIPLFSATGLPHDAMRVQVTIGVAEPDKLDLERIADHLPRGRTTIQAVEGGLNVVNPDSGNTLVIATAAVEAFLPKQA